MWMIKMDACDLYMNDDDDVKELTKRVIFVDLITNEKKEEVKATNWKR
jgi:hypothetical protein